MEENWLEENLDLINDRLIIAINHPIDIYYEVQTVVDQEGQRTVNLVKRIKSVLVFLDGSAACLNPCQSFTDYYKCLECRCAL